jgi:hypothetical protein
MRLERCSVDSVLGMQARDLSGDARADPCGVTRLAVRTSVAWRWPSAGKACAAAALGAPARICGAAGAAIGGGGATGSVCGVNAGGRGGPPGRSARGAGAAARSAR